MERAYVLCGDRKYGNEIVENILCSPSCPDWARRDVLARGDERLIHVAATRCSNVPPSFVRALSDKGYWRVAAACLSAPSDVCWWRWWNRSSRGRRISGCAGLF